MMIHIGPRPQLTEKFQSMKPGDVLDLSLENTTRNSIWATASRIGKARNVFFKSRWDKENNQMRVWCLEPAQG